MALSQHKSLALGTLIILLFSVGMRIAGQADVTVQIALPTWLANIVDDGLFERFEQQNPGIRVIVEGIDDYYFTSPATDAHTHFDEIQDYAQQADVLYVASSTLSQLSTDTGYLLELSPLTQASSSFNLDDFHPAMIDAFRWNNGTWAIPISGSPSMFLYDRAAFDNAGLPYPGPNWAFADLINTALVLTEYGANSEPLVPGFPLIDLPTLYMAFNPNAPLVDETQFPAGPTLDRSELHEFLVEYSPVFEQIMPPSTDFGVFENAPLQIARLSHLNLVATDAGQDWQFALLPGNRMRWDVTGLAVSDGTQHPEIAFQIIDFLTSDPQFVQLQAVEAYPARPSVLEDGSFSYLDLYNDVQTLVEIGLAQGIPTSHVHYFEFIQPIPRGLADIEGAWSEAITAAHLQAESALALAAERRSSSQIFVEPPISIPDIGNDQRVLHFGIGTASGSITNRNLWDEVIAEFVADNQSIGHVELIPLDVIISTSDSDDNDCQILLHNPTQSVEFNASAVLSFDPLMTADSDFSRSDFIGDSLEQVQRDSLTLAYPLTIEPVMVWYNRTTFAQAGVFDPQGVWSMDEFVDALHRVRQQQDSSNAPFDPHLGSGQTILMLTAAFGGLPYDTSMEPPVLALSDPVNAAALRQALDLAHDGLLAYDRNTLLGETLDDPGANLIGMSITTNNLSSMVETNEWQMVNFPSGSNHTPVSYVVTTAIINRDATDPQACYEFIDLVSRTPGLISGIPVRQSLLEDPVAVATLGQELADFSRTYVQHISTPHAVNFPTTSYGASSLRTLLEQMWLNDLFNRYILGGEDFDILLAETEDNMLAYRDCTANTDPMEVRQLTDCVVAISPNFRSELFWIYGGD